MVESSSVAGTNVAEICGLPDGRVLIPVFDWTTFFDEKLFKRIPNIKTISSLFPQNLVRYIVKNMRLRKLNTRRFKCDMF